MVYCLTQNDVDRKNRKRNPYTLRQYTYTRVNHRPSPRAHLSGASDIESAIRGVVRSCWCNGNRHPLPDGEALQAYTDSSNPVTNKQPYMGEKRRTGLKRSYIPSIFRSLERESSNIARAMERLLLERRRVDINRFQSLSHR